MAGADGERPRSGVAGVVMPRAGANRVPAGKCCGETRPREEYSATAAVSLASQCRFCVPITLTDGVPVFPELHRTAYESVRRGGAHAGAELTKVDRCFRPFGAGWRMAGAV